MRNVPIGSGIGVIWEVMKPLGGTALTEEVHHQGRALRGVSLSCFLLCFLCADEVESFSLLLLPQHQAPPTTPSFPPHDVKAFIIATEKVTTTASRHQGNRKWGHYHTIKTPRKPEIGSLPHHQVVKETRNGVTTTPSRHQGNQKWSHYHTIQTSRKPEMKSL